MLPADPTLLNFHASDLPSELRDTFPVWISGRLHGRGTLLCSGKNIADYAEWKWMDSVPASSQVLWRLDIRKGELNS